MIKRTKEQIIERHNALSPALQEFFTSDERGEYLWLIGEAHHLDEERIKKIAGIIGFIILGFSHSEDLAREIKAETNVDKRLADELAREIKLKILNPIIPELDKMYGHYGRTATATTSSQMTPGAPTQPEIMRPAFAPPQQGARDQEQETEGATERPFILHEGQGEIERMRPRDEALMRPSFYEDVDIRHQTSDISERSAARLEIGPSIDSGQVGKREPRVGKTEEPQIRVVHYSGPQTPVDPFGDQRPETRDQPLEVAERKTETPEDIHPENIVDLKDLPK